MTAQLVIKGQGLHKDASAGVEGDQLRNQVTRLVGTSAVPQPSP